jgi:hypothetical protein
MRIGGIEVRPVVLVLLSAFVKSFGFFCVFQFVFDIL